MSKNGELNWIFFCGDAKGLLSVTNLNESPVHLTFDIYFEKREPVKGLTCTIDRERVFCFNFDKPFCDQKYNIPLGHFSLVLHSDLPVVAVLKDNI